jgi:hypothetical protein
MNFGLTQPLTEMGIRNLPGVKHGWQPHHHLWADCPENVWYSTSHNPMGLHTLMLAKSLYWYHWKYWIKHTERRVGCAIMLLLLIFILMHQFVQKLFGGKNIDTQTVEGCYTRKQKLSQKSWVGGCVILIRSRSKNKWRAIKSVLRFNPPQ